MKKDGAFADAPSTKIAKTSGGSRKKFAFLGIALMLLGWFAYNNVSLPSDWVLYNSLLRETEKHPGKTFKLKLKDIYPSEWQKVCFYGTYLGREEILRHDGIDIQPTRARVWAGGEVSATFLFIYADGNIHAQRIKHGGAFNVDDKNSDLYKLYLSSCGGSNTTIEIEPNERDREYYLYSLIFHPSRR